MQNVLSSSMKAGGLVLLACAVAQAAPTADEAVAAAAREAVLAQAENAGLVAPEVVLTVLPLGAAKTAAECPQALQIEALDVHVISRMRFAARCGDGPRWQYVVRGELSAEVVVAVVSLTAGKPIAASDLSIARHTLQGVGDALSDLDAAAGQTASRAVRAGEVLSRRGLVASLMVKRGDGVSIEVHSGPVQVSTAGEALEPGRQGEVVRVRNASTGKVIRARVTAAGVVEPADGPISSP